MFSKYNYGLKENDVTPKRLFDNRRDFLKLGAASLVASGTLMEVLAKDNIKPTLDYLKDLNPKDLELNSYKDITNYNNFYEYSTSKKGIGALSQNLKTDPWSIRIDGLIEKDLVVDLDDLVKKFTLEERIYKFRCVEGWAMVVPWVGFELSKLIKMAKPLSTAKYVRFETLLDKEQFPDQRRGSFAAVTYPYVEGLRLDEAMNPLTLMAVGLYGNKMPTQNGAPVRLVVPWKYGFKSIKTITRITFTDKEPLNTWQDENADEYGFYANVNPKVDHPRWSQKKERVLGHYLKQRTKLFNGYGDEVAHMYKGMDLRKHI
jgi:sulfoxide reductase catalytic subunit YedY